MSNSRQLRISDLEGLPEEIKKNVIKKINDAIIGMHLVFEGNNTTEFNVILKDIVSKKNIDNVALKNFIKNNFEKKLNASIPQVGKNTLDDAEAEKLANDIIKALTQENKQEQQPVSATNEKPTPQQGSSSDESSSSGDNSSSEEPLKKKGHTEQPQTAANDPSSENSASSSSSDNEDGSTPVDSDKESPSPKVSESSPEDEKDEQDVDAYFNKFKDEIYIVINNNKYLDSFRRLVTQNIDYCAQGLQGLNKTEPSKIDKYLSTVMDEASTHAYDKKEFKKYLKKTLWIQNDKAMDSVFGEIVLFRIREGLNLFGKVSPSATGEKIEDINTNELKVALEKQDNYKLIENFSRYNSQNEIWQDKIYPVLEAKARVNNVFEYLSGAKDLALDTPKIDENTQS